jgi:competence protein ComEC
VYVLLSGSGPAALRSALMAGAALLAATRGRRTAPLPMLALAAAVMLAVSPAVARDVGFQLSFLGTLGIVLFARPLAARLPGPRMLADALAMTVAAQAATVPVMAGSFGVLSPVGPLTNAVVLPVLPLLMVLGGAGALLAVLTPQLAWLPLHAAALGCDLIVALSRLAETIPGGALHLGSWPSSWTLCEVSGCTVAGAFLFFVRNRVATPREAWTSRGAALVAGVAATAMSTFVFTGPDGRMRIVVLDTGSSPAVLVETPDGGTALVDGGSSASLLVTSLGRVLPPTTSHIDMVVVTGGERDAVAGLAGLVGRYSVGAVVAPVQLTAGAAAVITDLQLTGAGVAQGVWSWRWGGASWDCLDDRSTTTGRDLCALRVAASGASALVLGDAAADDQEQLAAVYGPVLRSDLVVSQPGGALSPLLLDAARPSLLAVPLARSGIPAAGLSALPAARTGVDGELTYVAGPAGLVEAG